MIVALAGGVGGAKLAQGLYLALPPETLTVVGNTCVGSRRRPVHFIAAKGGQAARR